jgi:rhodanese-related sulfurtransferase
MLYLIIPLLMILISVMYKRYYPIYRVPCLPTTELQDRNIVVLDIRDYNEASSKPVLHSINIPYAYLKRHYKEIPNRTIHVIASDRLERNLGLRFLTRKGFHVKSYYLMDSPCSKNQKKGVFQYGI